MHLQVENFQYIFKVFTKNMNKIFTFFLISGIDAILWEQAKKDNPDPKRQVLNEFLF